MSSDRTRCQVCAGKTDAYLCGKCAGKLQRAIAELPADLADLQRVATRQAVGPLGLGKGRQWDGPFSEGSLGDAPWEFAPGAADQVWVIANTLGTWARHLAESRGIPGPVAHYGEYETVRRLAVRRNRAMWITAGRWFIPAQFQPLQTLVNWLLSNIDAMCFDDAAEQIFDEITGLHDENERWILGRRGTEVFAGRCDAAEITFVMEGDALVPEAATCGTALYGNDLEPDLRCDACGVRYQLAERLEARDRQIEEQLARPHQIATALTSDDWPLSPDLLRKWIQRDAMAEESPEGPACEKCSHRACILIRRALILQQGTDSDGKSLYRFGDVRRRLALVQAQRGIRLSA